MAKSNLSFSKSLNRLDEIVAKLEEPDMDIEESLKLLAEGVKLHKLCQIKLTQASTKIKTILKEENATN